MPVRPDYGKWIMSSRAALQHLSAWPGVDDRTQFPVIRKQPVLKDVMTGHSAAPHCQTHRPPEEKRRQEQPKLAVADNIGNGEPCNQFPPVKCYRS